MEEKEITETLKKKTNEELADLATDIFASLGTCSPFEFVNGRFRHWNCYEGKCSWSRRMLIYNLTQAILEQQEQELKE